MATEYRRFRGGEVERTEDSIGLPTYRVRVTGVENHYYIYPSGEIMISEGREGHTIRRDVIHDAARRLVCEYVNEAFGTNWKPKLTNDIARQSWIDALRH